MSRTSVTNIPLDVDLRVADDRCLKESLAQFDDRLTRLERALDTATLAFGLQTAVMEDYTYATRRQEGNLEGQIRELQEALAYQTNRNVKLEEEVVRAGLARDGKLTYGFAIYHGRNPTLV